MFGLTVRGGEGFQPVARVHDVAGRELVPVEGSEVDSPDGVRRDFVVNFRADIVYVSVSSDDGLTGGAFQLNAECVDGGCVVLLPEGHPKRMTNGECVMSPIDCLLYGARQVKEADRRQQP